jgi:hypothetical protein
MSDIWLLESRGCADYTVIGAFSTEEKAARAFRLIGGNVRKVPLDPHEEEFNHCLSVWTVQMGFDGSVRFVGRDEPDTLPVPAGDIRLEKARTRRPAFLYAWIWAVTAEQAVAIMDERRLRYLEENQ